MTKFDTLNLENGMVIVTADGTKYVHLNGCEYNYTDPPHNGHYDFIVLNRDGTCPKFKSGAKDVVLVYQMNTCPTANRVSEGMKFASGEGSKYVASLVYSKNPVRDTYVPKPQAQKSGTLSTTERARANYAATLAKPNSGHEFVYWYINAFGR